MFTPKVGSWRQTPQCPNLRSYNQDEAQASDRSLIEEEIMTDKQLDNNSLEPEIPETPREPRDVR